MINKRLAIVFLFNTRGYIASHIEQKINAIFNATPKKNDKKRRKNIKLAISIDA